jgi:hypothetical protein
MVVNDILYTKDGRKSGNLTVIDAKRVNVKVINDTEINFYKVYECISDYGNFVSISSASELNGFYKELGKAAEGHKYFNYKKLNPELFV